MKSKGMKRNLWEIWKFQYIMENPTRRNIMKNEPKIENKLNRRIQLLYERIEIYIMQCACVWIPMQCHTQKYLHWNVHKNVSSEFEMKKKNQTYLWFFIHIHNICVQHWHMIVIKFYCFPFGGFEYCSYCTEKLQKCVD